MKFLYSIRVFNLCAGKYKIRVYDDDSISHGALDKRSICRFVQQSGRLGGEPGQGKRGSNVNGQSVLSATQRSSCQSRLVQTHSQYALRDMRLNL